MTEFQELLLKLYEDMLCMKQLIVEERQALEKTKAALIALKDGKAGEK